MNSFNEQASNAKGLLHGEYRAVVVSTEDPAQLMRAKVRLLSVWDDLTDDVLPWAEYKLPIGARMNEGGFEPCLVDDYVWVDFINGDTRLPRITGSCHYAPDGIPNMPHEAFAGEEKHTHLRHADEPTPPVPQYHDAVVFSRFGVLIEIAPDSSYRLTHKASGTSFEFTNEGHSVLHTEGDTYRSGTGKLQENIEGNWVMNVGGTTTINSTGHVKVIAPTIDVGSEGLEPAVMGDKLVALLRHIIETFNTHTVIGNLGSPTSTPTKIMTFEDVLSGTVKVQE